MVGESQSAEISEDQYPTFFIGFHFYPNIAIIGFTPASIENNMIPIENNMNKKFWIINQFRIYQK
jgi:hypothetical protein